MILWCNCPTGACHVVLDKHRFATLHAVDVDPLVLSWLPAKKDELPCPEKRSDSLLEKATDEPVIPEQSHLELREQAIQLRLIENLVVLANYARQHRHVVVDVCVIMPSAWRRGT